jgi:hypothetical protein
MGTLVSLRRINRTYRGKPTHHYELDGVRVDGVTTLIGGGVPKPALTYWSARTVAEYVADNVDQVGHMLDTGGRGPTVDFLKGVPWQKRDDAAVRGTEVHALAEQVVHGYEVEVPEHLHGHVDGYARWLDYTRIEPLLTEVTVGSREHGYAGTADLILRDADGVLRIADAKTSRGVYGETALQLAAYRWAEFYVATRGETPMPDTDDVGWVIHVTERGTDAYPVPVGRAQFDAFIAAASVARWGKTSRDLVGPVVRFGEEAA